MFYDPVKDIFASVIRKFPFLRIPFYKLLNLFFLRAWYVKRELKNIRKKLGSAEITVFDAGTGYGQYTYYISKNLQPNRIYAADIKEDWISDNKEFFKNIKSISFGIEDLTKIEYKEKFDMIVCIDVMEHIEDDLTVFRNFYNALKGGGYLLINTPSAFGGSDVHGSADESFVSEHARTGYSHTDFQTRLLSSGFSDFYYRYSYGYWGDKAWRLGIKFSMLLLNVSRIFLLVLPFYFVITFPFTLIMMYIDYKSENKTGTGITFIARK